jgi:hypothetical protein
LKDLCPQFDLWDSWFGLSQKYSPSSIVCSGADADGSDDADGDEAELQRGAASPDAISETGGDDGRMDDASEESPDADKAYADPSEHSASHTASPALQSPKSPCSNVAPGLPSVTEITAGRGRGRGRGRGQADAVNATAVVVAQKAALMSAVTSKAVVTSPSVSSGGSSGKNSFDAVYAEASKNKCEVMRDIELQRGASAASMQNAEHKFKFEERADQQAFQRSMEMEKQMKEHRFLEQQTSIKILAERQESKVKKQIEFDKTLASLLIADKSGALADDFEARRKRERQLESTADDPVHEMLQRFMNPRPHS